jgi:1-acyl-sn-glycerol-3-phosphate acyltransferase
MSNNYWYRLLSWLLVFFYYHRIRVLNRQLLPESGSILFVALHRNGAVDGYVYKSRLPRVTFLISVQLRRSWVGRIFFAGIEVARSKDRTTAASTEAASGDGAVAACADYIGQGGALLILPEGSSNLAHCHLPFQKGAARILARLMEDTRALPAVIPLGIHYERAWAWQSDVEVVVGTPIDISLPADISPAERVSLLHERITTSLEALAVQAVDAETFSRRECIAYAATLGSKRSYFSALKALEHGLPEAEALTLTLESEVLRSPKGQRLWLHQGVPLMPVDHAWAYPLLLCLLLPFVVSACVLNALPLLAARWAGRRFSDDRNTIALWRLLVGFPALTIWSALLLVVALWSHSLMLWFAYLLISLIGIQSVRRVQKLAIASHNWLFANSLREPLLAWRESLETCMKARNV